MKFEELDLNYDVLDALDAMHITDCTPIQEQSIPLTLEGRDLIAVAQTGTGKTAAYLLPVLNRLADGDFPEDAVNCIVMTPTRELAMQIDQQLQGFSYFLNVSSLPIYGGTDGATFALQQRGLKLGADVVIATPGRLLAHLQMGCVDLSRVSFFILDEADRMLDMGFFDDIMQIVKHLPSERQTLMFSATMPPKIQQLAKTILRDPAEVKIAVSRPAEKIDQRAYFCYEPQKLPLIKKLLGGPEAKCVLVFASSKLKVKEIARELRKAKVKLGEMHSDLDQNKREEVMLDFKAGRTDVLVATDIVARGIDIDGISMVVNYDVPHDAEDYVHRIGRTARASAEGVAVTFVSDKDRRRFAGIEKFLGKKVKRYSMDGETDGELSDEGPSGDNRGEGKRNGRKKGNGTGNGGRRNSRHCGHNKKPADENRAADSHKDKEIANKEIPAANHDGTNNKNSEGKKRPSRRWRNHGRRNGDTPRGNAPEA